MDPWFSRIRAAFSRLSDRFARGKLLKYRAILSRTNHANCEDFLVELRSVIVGKYREMSLGLR
jgi:hypothetical protein